MSDDLTAASGPLILLVEDEQIVREVIQETLTQAGYVVTAVRNAFEALDVVGELEPVTLLVTDNALPGMSGSELAARVADAHPKVKTLLISGYALGPRVGETRFPYLQKPFLPDELLAKIRQILGEPS